MSDLPPTNFVPSPNGKIAYHDTGSGPCVILLHGGGPGAYGYSNFRKNFEALAAKGLRVVIMDQPGYGQSAYRGSRDGGLFTPMADATLELIDHLGLDKANLVGNSLGGAAALRLALDDPDRVDRMILMGPGGSIPATSTFPAEGLLRMINFYEGDGPSLEKLDKVIDLLVYDRSTITRELVEERFKTATLPETMAHPPFRGQADNPRNELWREHLDKLPHRTLIIWGREDRVLPLDMSFIMLKRIPNADMHIFSKCGHWAQWERADEFNDLVADFLKRA